MLRHLTVAVAAVKLVSAALVAVTVQFPTPVPVRVVAEILQKLAPVVIA